MTTSPTATSRLPPWWKPYLAILAPMMLGNVLQVASGTIDGIYLGQMLGVGAIAAVSAFFPIFFFLLAVIIGLSAGATVLVGQAWGAKDLDSVRTIAGTASALMLCIAAAVSAGGYVLAPWLMGVLGTPADLVADATSYARLMLLGMPLIFGFWLFSAMSRGVGDAVTPLWALMLATAIGLVCTPAFIAGWWGLPTLGIASAAVSTMTAYTAALVWMFLRWRRNGHPLALDATLLRHVHLDAAATRKILRIGIPAAIQMLMTAAAEIVLLGLSGVLVGVMRASGTVLMPTVLGAFAIVGVELPAAYWLDAELGMSGIWWSYVLAYTVALMLQLVYFRMVWRRGQVTRLA